MATFQWYAVQVYVPHVGNTISYIQASSAQQAGENYPGSTVLGGPYPTEAAAQAAFRQGSHGTVPSKTGPPTTSDKPVDLNPLTGIMGDIAGGMENGVIVVLQDIWKAIVGQVFIALGIIFLLIAFVWFFKDQIATGAKTVAGVAGMAAAAA